MTFSAVALCPGSPLADIHDLIRVAVEAPNAHRARALMRRAGCLQVSFLRPSVSHVEEIAATAGSAPRSPSREPVVMACTLILAYSNLSGWEPLKIRRTRPLRRRLRAA